MTVTAFTEPWPAIQGADPYKPGHLAIRAWLSRMRNPVSGRTIFYSGIEQSNDYSNYTTEWDEPLRKMVVVHPGTPGAGAYWFPTAGATAPHANDNGWVMVDPNAKRLLANAGNQGSWGGVNAKLDLTTYTWTPQGFTAAYPGFDTSGGTDGILQLWNMAVAQNGRIGAWLGAADSAISSVLFLYDFFSKVGYKWKYAGNSVPLSKTPGILKNVQMHMDWIGSLGKFMLSSLVETNGYSPNRGGVEVWTLDPLAAIADAANLGVAGFQKWWWSGEAGIPAGAIVYTGPRCPVGNYGGFVELPGAPGFVVALGGYAGADPWVLDTHTRVAQTVPVAWPADQPRTRTNGCIWAEGTILRAFGGQTQDAGRPQTDCENVLRLDLASVVGGASVTLKQFTAGVAPQVTLT